VVALAFVFELDIEEDSVKIPGTILTALLVIGCSGETAPPTVPETTTAPPPNAVQAWLWGMIIEDSGACIPEATVEVRSGQARGRSVGQTPCDYWGYGGGFVFDSLTAGLEMTVRATAPGYGEKELTVLPGGAPWHGEIPLVIMLPRK
jgi:hypothetical protein